MIKLIRENLIFIGAAFIVVIILIVVLSIFQGRTNIQIVRSADDAGRIYGLYEKRHVTAAGNFLVEYEYPEGWLINENVITSPEGVYGPEQIKMYFVFERYEESYKYSKKRFGERLMYWNEYTTEQGNYNRKVVNVYWPLDSVNSSVRFTCSGPNEHKGEVVQECEKFILSFRLS